MTDRVGRVLVYLRVVLDSGTTLEWPYASGTAFAVASDGLLLTAKHVLEDAAEIDEAIDEVVGWGVVVAFGPDESEWANASIEKYSAYQDLAVLRVERTFEAPFAFSPRVVQGEEVWAWGFPGAAAEVGEEFSPASAREQVTGLLARVRDEGKAELSDFVQAAQFEIITTRGIISAVRPTEAGLMLQTDATIHSGNSGGPLLNAAGEVVGMITARHATAEGIGMAVSWESLRDELGLFPQIKWPR